MRGTLALAIVGIPAVVMALLLGAVAGLGIPGAVTGFLVGAPLGLYVTTRRRRWVASSVLNALFVFSYVVGEWAGVLFALMVSALTLFISAAVLRDLYEGNEFHALAHHLQILVGYTRGFQVISDGRVVTPQSSGPHMGPLLSIIGPENAVVMQRGASQTRISGPAVFRSTPFEYVKRVYDLRPHQRPFTFEDVLSSDLMSTKVNVSTTYSINIPPRASQGLGIWTSTHTDVLSRIDSMMTDWEVRTKEVIESSVRQAVGALDLEVLLRPGSFTGLARHVLSIANQTLRPWGVSVHQVIVCSVQPEDEVKTATTGRWIAGAETETTVTIERARALAWKEALELLAEGYRIAEQLGMSEQAIHREVLRRTLEQIVKDPASKVIFTPELNNTLTALMGSVGVLPGPS